jgi:hypothetical protein
MIKLVSTLQSGQCGGNTKVVVVDGEAVVYLHGNAIARYAPQDRLLGISNCGWETTTTKSRLNALLRHFGQTTIHQHKFVWYRGNERFMSREWINL